MAEQHDKDSKTEEATEKKVRDSLEKGQVPYSREAATFASILGILGAVFFLMGSNVTRLKGSLQTFVDDPGGWSLENSADVVMLFRAISYDVAALLIPFVLVIAVAGVSASLLQNQPQLVLDRIKPQLSRISITKGWTRVFGLQGQIEFLKSLFKLLIVGIAGYIAMKAAMIDVFNSLFMEPGAIPGLVQDVSVRLLATVATATAALVGADLVWSRISWRRDLRMSRQELKDEVKQTEGDPLVKLRLRSLQRDRSRKRMIAAVPRATLVIANPTHFSVALRYVREEGGAPLVVAKGKDLIALKIRRVAEEHGIPIYEDKALARSLYDSVEVERMIPPEFYKAVAGVILFLASRGKQVRPAL